MRTILVWIFGLLMIPQIVFGQTRDFASIEGTVVRAGTTDPVSRTRLLLVSPDEMDRTPLTTLADDSGRFAFTNVLPGDYQLMAVRDGYVKASYGKGSRQLPWKTIQIEAQQALKDVVIPMTPTGVIGGRIKNPQGDPMGNVLVRAERFKYVDGQKTLDPALTVMTNDLGEYRLYYLEPGQYLVSAIPAEGPRMLADGRLWLGNFTDLPGNPLAGTKTEESSAMSMRALVGVGVVSAAETGETYLTAYYPGVTDPSAATLIDLAPGASYDNADFVVASVRAVQVRGRIINGVTGLPAKGASVRLMSEIAGQGRLKEEAGTVSDSGDFEFRGVAPGTYDLVASLGALPPGLAFVGPRIVPGGPPRPSSPANTPQRVVAKTSIGIGKADATGITLSLLDGYTLSGRITVEGLSSTESEAATKDLVIQLQPSPQTFATAPTPAIVGANGVFTMAGLVPGRYQIGIRDAGNLMKARPGPYIKSAELGGIDGLNPRLVIDGEPRGQLEIIIANERGRLEVAVVDAKQKPAAGVTVVLVPDVPRRQHFSLYTVTETDDSGHATLSTVPGNYTAFAWDQVEEGLWWDPDFLLKHQGRGKAVRIDSDQKKTLELRTGEN